MARSEIGTRDNGLSYLRGGQVVPITRGFMQKKINCLLAGKHGDLWTGTNEGLFYWNGAGIATAQVPISLRHEAACTGSSTERRSGPKQPVSTEILFTRFPVEAPGAMRTCGPADREAA